MRLVKDVIPVGHEDCISFSIASEGLAYPNDLTQVCKFFSRLSRIRGECFVRSQKSPRNIFKQGKFTLVIQNPRKKVFKNLCFKGVFRDGHEEFFSFTLVCEASTYPYYTTFSMYVNLNVSPLILQTSPNISRTFLSRSQVLPKPLQTRKNSFCHEKFQANDVNKSILRPSTFLPTHL